MKIIFKIAASVVILFVVVVGGGIFFMSWGLEMGSQQVINSVNPATLADGDYSGNYDLGRWINEITVTVKNKKITKIDVVKDVTFSNPEWREQIFNRVIEKQNVNVDVISGATVTSKAYLKSIENALKG